MSVYRGHIQASLNVIQPVERDLCCLIVCRWVSSLRKAQMKETTIDYYVQNVSQFITFISETPPPSCRLSKTVLIGLRREMLSIKKSLRRKVAMHRTSVKTGKEQRVISKGTLLQCQSQAKQAIPKILGKFFPPI